MSSDRKKAIETLNTKKVWIPAGISIGFVVYMLLTDENFSAEKLSLIFTGKPFPLFMAGVLLVIKEGAYMFRIYFLSDKKLTFTGSAYIILLWEFASAVTPSVVGGTPVAVFLMMKEGINVGKSLAYAMITAIFDNLYLVILTPVIYLLYKDKLFNFDTSDLFIDSIPTVLAISYSLILFYTVIMIFSIFYQPRLFKWILIKITGIKFLRKWRYNAYQYGNEIMMASVELRGKGFSYWWRISYTTFISWTARFAMLNFMIIAFIEISLNEHFISFSKHLVLWNIMLASPTPGSSFAAEMGFSAFFGVLLQDFTAGVTILWRTYTYYPFLLIGSIVLPRWISRVYLKKGKRNVATTPAE